MNGQTYIDNEIAQELAANPGRSVSPLSILSAREYELFLHLIHGVNINAIASCCCLSPKTVRSHKTNIMRKLNISNMVDFVRLAMQSGLITEDNKLFYLEKTMPAGKLPPGKTVFL